MHVAAIEEMAGSVVLGEIAGAEIGGQQAEAAFAPEIELPEFIACGIEALHEEEVRLVLGLDMGNAPSVDADFRGVLQPLQRYGLGGDRLGHIRSRQAWWQATSGSVRSRRQFRVAPASRFRSQADSAYGRRSRREYWPDSAIHR